MEMKKVEIEVPAGIEQYTVLEDKDEQLKRNAMLVYPYIQNGTISHGKAAELLGIYKMDLITLYGGMGIAYFDESREELEADLKALESLENREYAKEKAFKKFIEKMYDAEKSVEYYGYYSEEEVEEELAKI